MSESTWFIDPEAGAVSAEDDDNYDDEDEEDDEEGPSTPEELAAAYVCTSRRIAYSYVDAEIWATYDFLAYARQDACDQMLAEMTAHLSSEFGKPDPDADPYYVGKPSWDSNLVWPSPLKHALPGVVDTQAMPQQLWVGMSASDDCADGNKWCEIWLHCAPSMQALKTLMSTLPAGADPASIAR